MTDLWLGYAEGSGRREVILALRQIAPGAGVVFARTPFELRERFLDEEPGTVGAVVGHVAQGVSDLNLAAAVANDGRASEVVLVARGASGSLRSRAKRAGITHVIDATVSPAFAQTQEGSDAPAGKGDEGSSGETRPASQAGLPQTEVEHVDAPEPQVDAPVEQPRDERRKGGPVIVATSWRGGVGKTSLVALLAMAAASWGMKVALVDLDLSCGNLHTCFGITQAPDLARMVADGTPSHESMARASVRCAERVQLWGPCERPEMGELVMPHASTLLSYLSASYDLVLVDTSSTFTDAVAQAVQSCDRLLVVHDERPGAVASAARISALAVRLGVARTRIVRVADLADPRTRPNMFEGRAAVGLETARLHRVVDGGIEAEELLAAGKVAELADASSDLVACVGQMLAQMLSELGCLPDNDEARKALQRSAPKRRFALFSKHKEAV